MATISSTFFDQGTGPYSRPLKVKVASYESVNYKGPDGSEQQTLHSAIIDAERVIKLVGFDQGIFFKLAEGNLCCLEGNNQNRVVLWEIIRNLKTEHSQL